MIVSAADLYQCARDPWYLISNFFRTFDEHDELVPVEKPFPAHWEYPYKRLIEKLEEELRHPSNRTIIIPKSRQVMVSWVVCGYMLAKAMYRPQTACVIQSKEEKDSIYQIKRTKEGYRYFDEAIKKSSPLTKELDRQPEGSLNFANGSAIVGIAGGGDKIRSSVPTILLSDEAAFQDDLDEVMRAAKSNVKLHIVVSSPKPGVFQKLVEDTYGT